MSNKTRKLEYIRAKNRLRLGGFIYRYIESTSDFDDRDVNVLFEKTLETVSKIYKLPLIVKEASAGYTADNFVKNIFTIQLKIVKA
tara:strand:+ start:917 stop:1174 length:258 start_codon:yes stop_codon:yes gene_type:complete